MAFSIKNIFEKLREMFGDQITALILSQLLTEDNIIKAVDYILDLAEELAEKTPTKIDDSALAKIRQALNIPDNDEPKA